MPVFAKSRNLAEGKFMKPPDPPKRDPPRRLPNLELRDDTPFEYVTTKVELPPWLQKPQTEKIVKSSNKNSKVSFMVPTKKKRKKRRRRGTLYDSVAGRMGKHGFQKLEPQASKYRDTKSTGERVLAPEEVLIRRPHHLNNKMKGEPYFAHEHLPRTMRMPPSDMLTAIHAYAADWYKYGMQIFKPVYRSMDESALLAFGILAEELAKDKLGTVGHRVLLDDPEATDNEDPDNPIPKRLRTRLTRAEKFEDPRWTIKVGPFGEKWIRKRRKRVKTATDGEKKKTVRKSRKRRIPEWLEREMQSFEKWQKEQAILRQQAQQQEELERRALIQYLQSRRQGPHSQPPHSTNQSRGGV